MRGLSHDRISRFVVGLVTGFLEVGWKFGPNILFGREIVDSAE